jgi:hypothetical protein
VLTFGLIFTGYFVTNKILRGTNKIKLLYVKTKFQWVSLSIFESFRIYFNANDKKWSSSRSF